MPSSYTSNTGLEKPATGEQSGTWGNTVNTDLDLIDQATDGYVSISLSSTTHTLTTTDATLSDGRNKVVNFTGSPGGNCTVTISPNDAEKWYFVRNNTSGGFDLILTQGSGSTFTLKNGCFAVIHCDGAGAGASVAGTLAVLQVTTLHVALGSASAPSIVAQGDTNTGVWFPAADAVGISTGGVQAVHVDSSQRVGVGTQTPAASEAASRHTVSYSDGTSMVDRVENTGAGLVGRVWARTGGTTARWNPYIPAGSTDFRFSSSGADFVTFTASGNIGFNTTDQFGSGTKVIGIANATVAPSANPTGGGVLYADAGAGKWRGSSGTVTTFGPAEPHCPSCGSDFVLEWKNKEKYGHLIICMRCMSEELGPRSWITFKK